MVSQRQGKFREHAQTGSIRIANQASSSLHRSCCAQGVTQALAKVQPFLPGGVVGFKHGSQRQKRVGLAQVFRPLEGWSAPGFASKKHVHSERSLCGTGREGRSVRTSSFEAWVR